MVSLFSGVESTAHVGTFSLELPSKPSETASGHTVVILCSFGYGKHSVARSQGGVSWLYLTCLPPSLAGKSSTLSSINNVEAVCLCDSHTKSTTTTILREESSLPDNLLENLLSMSHVDQVWLVLMNR